MPTHVWTRAAVLLLAGCTACSGCKKDGSTPASASGPSASPAANLEVGDRLHFAAPEWTDAELEGYPQPVPVEAVARAKEIVRLAPSGDAEAEPKAHAANRAVELSLLDVTQTQALPGLKAPAGKAFVVLTTRWKNVHPRKPMRKSDLKPDRTMGVGGFARGGQAKSSSAGDDAVLYEADVAYQIPRIEDHAWLVADGAASAIDPVTPTLFRGAPYGRSITIARLNDTRDLQLVYLVPEGAKALALQFFDNNNGDIRLPVRGAVEDAVGERALPSSVKARGKVGLLDVGVLGSADRAELGGVSAPEGWRFVAVQLTGLAKIGKDGSAIIQVDPRKFVSITTTDGQVRYASGGSVSPKGMLRFPPGLVQRHEVVFAVPKAAKLSSLSLRGGAETATLALGEAPTLPSALVEGSDGKAMNVKVLGLWRGSGEREGELVLDLAVDNRVKTSGLELSSAQFHAAVDRKVLPVDEQRTAELVFRPPSPFIVPPGATARFQLAFETADPPAALQVEGFEQKLELALSSVKESEQAPVHGDPSHRADDLVPPEFEPSPEVDEDAPPFAIATSGGPELPVPPPLPFPDDREPNDRAETASLLGEDREARGAFAPGGTDYDVYRFTVTGAPALYRLEAEGEDLTELRYQGVSAHSFHAMTARDGRAALPDLYLLPGTHFVSVKGMAKGGAGPSAYAVRLVSQGARPAGYEGEPDDDGARGERILLGEEHAGRVSHANDSDVYLLSLTRSERLAFRLQSPKESTLIFELHGAGERRLARSATPGAAIDYRTELPPGDFELTVRSNEPSLEPYRLVVQRLDPFVTAGDFEPNEDADSASELSPELVVVGTAARESDRDVYRLPRVEAATEVVFTPSGEVTLTLRDEKGAWIDLEPLGDGDPRQRAKLPAGASSFLTIDTRGPYSVKLDFAQGPRPTSGALPVALTLGAPASPVAAWSQQAQRLELPLGLAPTQDLSLTLRAWTSHPGWRAELEQSATVRAGQKRALAVKVTVAPDAWSEVPVQLVVEARGPGGQRTSASTELRAECGASPVGAHLFRPLPEALLGGLDVASRALGATVSSGVGSAQSEPSLQSGLVTLDHDFSALSSKLPFEVTFDLAGDEPVEVAGFLLHPPGAMVRSGVNPVREFEVLLSQDGQSYTSALSGVLDELAAEQAFPLPRPVPARFARLRFKSEWDGGSGYVGLATFKVVAKPGWVPSGAAGGFDVADPNAGGHLVWADPAIAQPRAMLSPEREHATYRPEAERGSPFVIGFHQERAARLRAIEWDEPREPGATSCAVDAVQVAVSMTTPLGPWTALGSWKLQRDPQGLARLELKQPTWARYVQFTLPPAAKQSVTCGLPDALRIFEAPASGSDRSILGEWGQASQSAGYEWQQPARPAMARTESAAHATRETALELKPGEAHPDSVERGVDEDWYRLEIPEGQNTVTVTIPTETPSRLEWRLEKEDRTGVPLVGGADASGTITLRGKVEPKQTYWLRIGEPQRSVVFTWDSSGSVAAFAPQIYQALTRFASAVRPGREQVHLLPFGADKPLTLSWTSDPYTLLETINDYDERDSSSDAEGSLRIAAEVLASASGSRAVMTVTDDDSGAGPDEEARLWSALAQSKPRVFAVQIPLGQSPDLFQDRMQTWARVDDGHYGAFRTGEELGLSFERATCLLRRPATYAVTLQTSHEVPPRPGQLLVTRKGASDGTAFEIIYDASGSMYQKLGGSTRLQVAREVMSKLAASALPAGTPVALRAYGHLLPRKCKTQLVVPLRPHDPKRLAEVIRKIEPQDRSGTPLAESLAAVATDLQGAAKQKVVVLVTDGQESCGGDPAAAIKGLREKGIDVRLNIVGFALDASAQLGLSRWAEWGGGRYYDAKNGDELLRAVEQALNPSFQVLGPGGETIATGTVNGASLELPPGDYSVRVSSSPPELLSGIHVKSAQVEKVELKR